MTRTRRKQGVVLFIVLFFTLLLTASIATFVKRATVDAILSRNRDAMARTEALAREIANAAYNPGRRDRHSACADAKTPAGVGDADRPHDLVVVVERFAHPHVDEVVETVGRDRAPQREDLLDDLSRGERADEPHRARCAESASETATDLARDAPGRPLFNRALNGGYEPGSTLKPFVALAGLELDLITPQTRVFSNGKFYIEGYDRPYRDWKDMGHGWVTLGPALEQSVNTYFYQLAMDMGIDRMHDYLSQFGFGSTTGIDVPGEGKGLLPSREWKLAVHDLPWYPGETVIAGIGQGFNVVTPVQLANAVATLVNGGTRYSPRLVYATKLAGVERAKRFEAPIEMQVPIRNPQDWQAVLDGMDKVVNGLRGTARRIAVDAHYRIGGKTGTAQVYKLGKDKDYKNREVPEHLRDHALFIAFAPVEAPRIAIAVVVEHGGAGSKAAAPVARATLDAWLDQEIGRELQP